jgi:hypothetical protein
MMTNNPVPGAPAGDPRSRVSNPAVGLLITGIIGGIFELTSFISGLFGASWLAMMADDVPESVANMFRASFWTAGSLVGMLIAAFLVLAWSKMKNLESWGLCVAASILAMVPCISPCCLIGLPVGVWCLVILNSSDVKAAFH